MSFFLNPQETAHRYGDYIEELRAILAANNIKFGSPDNFFAFARRLQSDDLLPGDLSRMVKSIIERETDTVSLRTILTIIAIAVGGSAVTEANRSLSKPLNLVLDFLVRSGDCIPADPEHMDSISLAPFTTFANLESTSGEEPQLPPGNTSSDQIPYPPPGIDNLHPLDTSQLIQSLSRLELKALESKLYLDSVEQRLNRMEPLLENVSSPDLPLQNHSCAPDIDPLHQPDSPAEPPSTSSDPHFPSFVRRNPTQTKTHFAWFFVFGKKIAGPPLLATLAGGTLLYVGYQRSSMKTGTHPNIAGSAATINHAPITLAPTGTTAESSIKPQPSTSSSPDPTSTALGLKPIRNPIPAKPSESPTYHTVSPSTPPANLETVEVPHTLRSTETVAKAKRDVAYTFPHSPPRSASPMRTVDVSSGVMAGNLVSSSPPSYPKLASLTHLQGKVVMQAIISKDGTVQNLHVIQGHRLLRSAAKNSARTWRYRPYLVNGKPVEVATIVSVDFNLGR
jgi:outer membrane biosynthesis protein TonB